MPLPNSLHREWVERAAAAGKHVLCEKPLAPTAADAEAMAAACAAAGVTLLEAYMTPFHPRAAGDRGAGRLRPSRRAALRARGLHRHARSPRRPSLAAGDGRRGAARRRHLLHRAAPRRGGPGARARRGSGCRSTESGVDASFSGWLDLGDGFTAAIECSFDAPERQSLEIVGTEARAGRRSRVHARARRTRRSPSVIATVGSRRSPRAASDPYRAMIDHFAAVVRGETGPRRSCADSIALLSVLDRLREAAGIAIASL